MLRILKKTLKYSAIGFGGLIALSVLIALCADPEPEKSAETETPPKIEPVETEEEITTDRYAAWIVEHGRERAGEMMNEEIDASFEAKDGRVELLINAKSKAMLQDHERSQRQKAEREAALQERVDAQFSPWDGSHRVLVEAVKKTLNDPGSFEHLETKTMRGTGWPETFVVRMEYTAKNAFGGRVRKFVLVEVTGETGRIVQVFDEG
ncbi:MAG: hypothetical protein OXG98_01215 [Gemmatimonadetes bacterium]|nr:hypothetical protein [Gemmatimonadota bacterium]